MTRGFDPNAVEPIGRQPSRLYISPSKTYLWYGCIIGGTHNDLATVGGLQFTEQQTEAMCARGVDPETCEVMTVKRQATDREICSGWGVMPPVFAFDCPVLGRRADGKVKIITPSGDAKFIRGDGWANKPRTRPGSGFY